MTAALTCPDLIEVERELLSRSLRDFVEEAWPVLEPGTDFIGNWHIDAICEHLEAISRGDITRLIINIPPRCMKSILVGVMWPAWEWTFRPESRWLCSSYAQPLSTRDSRKTRLVIASAWYQRRWGHVFQLAHDQNVKLRFENDKHGYRIATSVGGGGTGEGGNRVVVDDPHNVLEANSERKLEEVRTWWDETMSTRLNDPDEDAFVVVMQRVHSKDLTGHILLKDSDYEHLMLPMRYETTHPTPCWTSLGTPDLREDEGELLWDERYGEPAVDRIERDLGQYATAGQHGQRPAPREGGLIKVDNMEIVDAAPSPTVASVRGWDKAGTKGGGARTAGVRLDRLADGRYLVVHVVKGQWSQDKREKVIRQMGQLDGLETNIWMEQEPGSAGKDIAALSARGLAGLPVRSERATGDKVRRAEPFGVQTESCNILLLRGDWNQDYIDELRLFPNGEFKDQMDASSLAFNKVALGSGWGDYYGGQPSNGEIEGADVDTAWT